MQDTTISFVGDENADISERYCVAISPLMTSAQPGQEIRVGQAAVVSGLVQEYCILREATPYTDALGQTVKTNKEPIVKPLMFRQKADVLDEDDLHLMEKAAAGGMDVLLGVLSASEQLGCLWLFDVTTVYIAFWIQEHSPDDMRTKFASQNDLPTDRHHHARFIQSLTFNSENV